MSLDPQIADLLASMNERAKPDFSQLTAIQYRQALDSFRLPAELAPSVRSVRDQRITGPAGEIPVRIYQAEASVPLPILVYFHGGGFVVGNLDTHDNLCRALCSTLQAVVVAVDYRLAPEHKFPAAVDDAYSATLWAAQNALMLGGDPACLLVGGDSAGGNLAAVVCQQARDAGMPTIAHQILLYPVCDNDLGRDSYQQVGSGYLLETNMMAWFWRQYLSSPADARQAKACPLKGNTNRLPSATVVTAEYDPLRDEGEAYAQRMAQAGVAVKQFRVPGAIHGYLNFVGMLTLADDTLSKIAGSVNSLISR